MNKRVLVYAASGGLGSAICKEFHNYGYDIILSGRNFNKIKESLISTEITGDIRVFSITDEIDPSLFNDVDIVINASGMDIRKPLSKQSLKEIKSQIDLNVFGVINLTKVALQSFTKKGKGQILHIGGFADGSWAMPYYTVDVATRAGIFSFIESINLEIHNKEIIVQYFCPQPADTVAERPYHKLWKSQGIAVVSKEKVAKDIYSAIRKSKKVTIQGNFISRFISTKLKYQFPKFFTKVMLEPMGHQTMKFFDDLKEYK